MISLVGTNALWEFEMTLGRIVFTRFAVTFDTTRATPFPRLMGRYSVMYSGFVLFGMRTTWEWCIFRRQWPERKTKRTTEVTSGSTMDHNCWKKYDDVSLGPEDLEGHTYFIFRIQ